MLIACVQTDVRFAAVNENLDHVSGIIERLGRQKVELAVFPECVLTGYGFESRQEAIETAPSLNSDVINQLVRACHSAKTTITIGSLLREHVTEADGESVERLFNAALMIDGTGVLAIYHKIHLPHLGVDRFVDRGQSFYQTHLTASGCRVGMGICYDSSFPEPMRALGLAGADVIALGTNWPVAASRTAEIVPPARSMENHLYFVAANRIGSERGFDYCGMSSICGPDGVELARAKADEPIELIAEIDLHLARTKRIERTAGKHVIDRFADRRPEFYGSLAEPIDP